MKFKNKFFIVPLMFIILIMQVYGACVVPVDNLVLNASVTLCNNNSVPYNIDDTADDGVITFNADDIVLDCNGTTLTGIFSAGSIGIYENGNDNLTVKNCNVSGYDYGISLRGSSNSNISNNTLGSCINDAIRFREGDDSVIVNNRIQGNTTSPGNLVGINLLVGADRNIIEHNNINYTYRSIKLATKCNNATIQHNRMFNTTTSSCINLDTTQNYTNIYNNTVQRCGHNGIDIDGWYNNVSYNTIKESDHVGIDVNWGNDQLSGGYNRIFNNYIEGFGGVLIRTSINNSIYNNTIYQNGTGLTAEGNNTVCYDNIFYDNTVTVFTYDNITAVYPLKSGGCKNTKFINNTIVASNYTNMVSVGGFYANPYHFDNSTFINNNYPASPATFQLVQENFSLTIQEDTDVWFNNSFSGDTSNVTIVARSGYSFRLLNGSTDITGWQTEDYEEVFANGDICTLEWETTRSVTSNLEACDNIMSDINSSFTLAVLAFIVLIAGLIITTLMLVMGGGNVDLKTYIATFSVVMVMSIITLIGYYLIARTQGAIC